MKASDLRIGNWFLGYDDNPFQWSVYSFVLLNDGCEIDELIKAPIPLTEDWLLKFGFDCVWAGQGDGATYHLQGGRIVLHSHDFVVNFYLAEFEGSRINIKIPSVHQLQNLYHSLTGEDLMIQETNSNNTKQ